MKTFGTFLGTALALAILAAFIAGGYYSYLYIDGILDTLNPYDRTMVLIATAVAIFCSLIIAGGLRSRIATAGVTGQKVIVYEQLLLSMADRLNRVNTDSGSKADEGKHLSLERLLALHASSKVMAIYIQFKKTMSEGPREKNEDEIPKLLQRFILAMRADLGHRETNLKEKDFMDLLLGRIE
jgi:hypothetical protein